jgi:tetratricopeptide (TPR) repeat protein
MGYLAVAFLALVCVAQTNMLGQSQDWANRMEKGNALSQAGNYPEAVVAFREAVQILERSESQLVSLASALNSLATAYDDLGRTLEAEQYYRRALAVIEKASGQHSLGRAQILVNLSCVGLHQEQFAKAEKNLREAVAIYIELVSPDDPLLAIARSCLARALLGSGALEEAATLIDQALAVLEKETDRHDGYYGMTVNNKGTLRWAQGRRDEAMLLFKRSLAALELEKGPDNPIVLYSLNNLAVAQFRDGHTKEAAALLSRAVLIAETHLGTDNPLYGQLLKNYAECLRKTGRKAEAKSIEVRAADLLKASAQNTGTGYTVDVSALRAK